MTVAGFLMRAADLLRTRGWVRGTYQGPGGRLCAYAALIEAQPDRTRETRAVMYAALEHLARAVGHDAHVWLPRASDLDTCARTVAVRRVVAWNDAQLTGDVVITRLEREAATLGVPTNAAVGAS
jgi:hypothetical protein